MWRPTSGGSTGHTVRHRRCRCGFARDPWSRGTLRRSGAGARRVPRVGIRLPARTAGPLDALVRPAARERQPPEHPPPSPLASVGEQTFHYANGKQIGRIATTGRPSVRSDSPYVTSNPEPGDARGSVMATFVRNRVLNQMVWSAEEERQRVQRRETLCELDGLLTQLEEVNLRGGRFPRGCSSRSGVAESRSGLGPPRRSSSSGIVVQERFMRHPTECIATWRRQRPAN